MKLIRFAVYVAISLAMFGAGWHFGQRETATVHAQVQTSITVPKSYGIVKGTGLPLLMFEAPDGTIRLVDGGTGRVEGLVSRK